MTALSFRIRRREELDGPARARMLALMKLCYDNVDDARFYEDLDHKQHVITLVDEREMLQGFSTVRIAEESLAGSAVDILFSGDTVIHPNHWGSKALQRGFLAFVLWHRVRRPRRRLYWLLLSKGYKTYLLLANNFPSAFPRRDYVPPAEVRALRDRVGRAWWGEDFDPNTDLLRFATARDRVKNGVATLDAETRERPDVAFFLQKNPRWADGDELVCLAEVDLGLPFRFAWKQFQRRILPRRLPSMTASPDAVRRQ